MAPLIVITGPTASGKSELAVQLAQRWNGEIICADSRTLYTGLAIGTAKPSIAERQAVRHHIVDCVAPNVRFTVHDFQQQARQAIADIRSRNKVPFLVGGTGLYIDSVILDYTFGPDRVETERARLTAMSLNELQSLIKRQHISMPENDQNKRFLIRAIERAGHMASRKLIPDEHTYVVAIATDKSILRKRIEQRVRAMVAAGVLEEAETTARLYGWECEALSGNIYKELRQYVEGASTLDEVIERCATRDWQLAKRQLTWLRRHDFVQWMDVQMAEQYFDHILGDYRDAHPY